MQANFLFLTSVYWLLWLGRRRFRSGLDRNEGDVSVSRCSVAGQAGLHPAPLPACVGSFLFGGKEPGYLTCSMPAHPVLSSLKPCPSKFPQCGSHSQPRQTETSIKTWMYSPSLDITPRSVRLLRVPEKSQVPQASSHQLLY